MLRTQIYLPEELRKEIDKHRAPGESLAEYVRKAVEEKAMSERKKKAELKRLAEKLGSRVKKSGWGNKADVLKWQREIRKDRKIL